MAAKRTPALSILTLPINAEYFGEIARGEKKIEYRERKPHWASRIEGRSYVQIQFRNGYRADSPCHARGVPWRKEGHEIRRSQLCN